ncbi:unnamed protein product [Linum trigynum]|uniref:SMP domain-containing protein n=1 Tax=Linum trigynum TaxID=586398 RepID=A0AAV2GC67_9ROSI
MRRSSGNCFSRPAMATPKVENVVKLQEQERKSAFAVGSSTKQEAAVAAAAGGPATATTPVVNIKQETRNVAAAPVYQRCIGG